MSLKTICVKEQKQVTVDKEDLLRALGLDPEKWNIHSAFVSNSKGIIFGISEKSIDSPFEL